MYVGPQVKDKLAGLEDQLRKAQKELEDHKKKAQKEREKRKAEEEKACFIAVSDSSAIHMLTNHGIYDGGCVVGVRLTRHWTSIV